RSARNIQNAARVTCIQINKSYSSRLVMIKKSSVDSKAFFIKHHGGWDIRVGLSPRLFTRRRVNQSKLLPVHLSVTLKYSSVEILPTSPLVGLRKAVSGTSLSTVTPGPSQQSRPIVTLLAIVAFTPRKQFSPTSTKPEITTCDDMKQLSLTVEWWPM